LSDIDLKERTADILGNEIKLKANRSFQETKTAGQSRDGHFSCELIWP